MFFDKNFCYWPPLQGVFSLEFFCELSLRAIFAFTRNFLFIYVILGKFKEVALKKTKDIILKQKVIIAFLQKKCEFLSSQLIKKIYDLRPGCLFLFCFQSSFFVLFSIKLFNHFKYLRFFHLSRL